MNFKITHKIATAAWFVSVLLVIAVVVTALAPAIMAQDAPRAPASDDRKRWQAVAPGRVEPWSGEIKLAAPIVGRIGEVLVKPNDTVFEGELLIRLVDDEIRARLATAEAQVALRRRARNDLPAANRAADRRRAEDVVTDADKTVVEARSVLDAATTAKRTGRGSDGDIEAARSALARAQERVRQARTELRRLESDTTVPLPVAVDGQLNVAHTEWMAAAAAVEKMMIRSPLAGTVLQVNARAGELAGPSTTSPLLVLGDISALRVRAEVDERDFGEIKIGQAVQVRSGAFRGRDIAGKVSAIAPIVEAGRSNLRGQRGPTDVNVVEVLVDLSEPGPLVVGMKVDVYFHQDGQTRLGQHAP